LKKEVKMTLDEIITSCLFLTDNDEVASALETVKPYYTLYLKAIEDNEVRDYITIGHTELFNESSINHRKEDYDEKVAELEGANKICKSLKFIANKVLKLISTNYINCLEKENITITNGEFDLSNLEKSFRSLKGIENSNKKPVYGVEIVKNKLQLNNGTYTIKYIYNIDDYDYFENITDFGCGLTYGAVVDGVLGEYYILNGFYDEADFYLKRFESQMTALNRSTCEKRIKGREWL